jgi:hypothetical protein
MSHIRKLTAFALQLALVASLTAGFASANNGGREQIKAEEMKEWLTYFASDEFEGRATFTEGLGLAAGYLAAQLKAFGVRPGGPNGSYFQRVAVQGVKSDNRSTVTVEVNGQTRTFKNREGINFLPNVGAKRSFTTEQIEFVGYGLVAPAVNHNDYAGRDIKGKVAVWLGSAGPKTLEGRQYRRLLTSRARTAIEEQKALAGIGPVFSFRGGAGATAGGGRGEGSPAQTGSGSQSEVDFNTAQRLDNPIPPAVTAQDEFLEFLFSGSDVKYAELKAKAQTGEPLSGFTLKNARITFNLDASYRVTRTQYTRNVIGVVEGSDPRLKDSYVAYGAHYDHVGYAEGEVVEANGVARRSGARGVVTAGAVEDRVWNGADDDGSGSIAMLAIARAFAQGPKPRRSMIFVWHAGEERGLWGSRHFVDYPTVPLDKIVAEINMDMVGRDRNNDPKESNTLYAVGSDRISTEFHNITVDANQALSRPLQISYEMNDPSDTEQIYYRSDHYSYAAKGIPIIFLTTGLHPDYHANTDSADKINYGKMARIGQYAYEIGMRVGNLANAPARDNRGPRAGRDATGKLKM